MQRLLQFEEAVISFLRANLGEEPGADEFLSSVKEHLHKLLDTVFEGLLISSSTISAKHKRQTAKIVAKLRDLTENNIYLIVIDDHPTLGDILRQSRLENTFILSPSDPENPSHSLAVAIGRKIKDNGLHSEKIALVGALSQELVAGTLKIMHEYPVQVFASDFSLDYHDHLQRLRPLPITRDANSLLQGSAALKHLLETLVFARRINVTETALLVRHGEREGGILERLTSVGERAQQNRKKSLERLEGAFPHLKNAEIFDHRSGAVFFRPPDWRHFNRSKSDFVEGLHEYFRKKLSGYWQPGRPCFKRILFTPTKVLLRGEQYYSHMKNASPVDRIRAMLQELSEIQALGAHLGDALEHTTPDDQLSWKLCLAFLDQFRNIALQFFSFTHATEVMLTEAKDRNDVSRELTTRAERKVRSVYGDEGSRLHSFVGKSVGAYYSWLLGQPEHSREAFDQALACMQAIYDKTEEICDDLEEWFGQEHLDINTLRVRDLVRRWREADHPGENLMVALQAVEEAEVERHKAVHAVGIGWGGVELPFIFRFLAKKMQTRAAKAGKLKTSIANWSHYRGGSTVIHWVPFPKYSLEEPTFADETALVFDDNTLSGITLERIRDAVLLNGGSKLRLYVTRFSGERRWFHMQMAGHGVIDPNFMETEVRGYLGETPYSRSWSAKGGEYKSQIGVFSLARRRILECIHNNSTVEAWDREGF